MTPQMTDRFIDLCRRYGKQPTTWLGGLQLAAAAGVFTMSEQTMVLVAGALSGVIGAILVLYDEDKPR